MFESTCDNCGAPIFTKNKAGKQQFCNKACYHQFLRGKPKPQEPKRDVKPRNRYIHPEGYTNLLCAIVRRAREDIMGYPPCAYVRIDAEQFFTSGDCDSLTGLDGRRILAQIHAEYNRRHRKGARRYDAE